MKKESTYFYKNTSSGHEAFNLASDALINAKNNNLFPVKVDFQVDQSMKVIEGRGKGFDVKLSFSEEFVDIYVDLSFMLRPIKGKIIDGIESELKKYL